MQIFHVATLTDWTAAQASGAYTTSSRGVTLEEEGFLHACRTDQLGGVYDRYYADADEPLVLLTIDTDLLDVPWQEDPVGDDTFPHIYGRLAPAAVIEVAPISGRP